MRASSGVLALVLAAAFSSGCLALDALGASRSDPTVVTRAPVLAKNHDAHAWTLHYVTRLDDQKVDGRVSPIAPNGTASASIGFPAAGNTLFTVDVIESGKTASATLTPNSCAKIEIRVAISQGLPSLEQVACG